MRKRYEDLELDDGTVVRYQRHDNGGGLVAKGAVVDESAYVAETAWVDPGARVEARARIGQHCWVEPGARVEVAATIGSHAHVGRGASVGAGSTGGTRCEVGADARLEARAVVAPESRVEPGAVVPGDRVARRLDRRLAA
jgi:UDP-3-O-[3-hydroxymyristoyl] glucosamine N-acyltransferase